MNDTTVSTISISEFLESKQIDFRFRDQKLKLTDVEKLLIEFCEKAIVKQKIISAVSEAQRCATIRNGPFRVFEDLQKAEEGTPTVKIIP